MTTMLPNGTQAIDQMDRCLDLVRTAYLALCADGGVVADDIEAIRGTLSTALADFRPIREKLNKEMAASWPEARDPRMQVRGETRS